MQWHLCSVMVVLDVGLLLRDFALTRLQNLHHILNLCDDVHCNAI